MHGIVLKTDRQWTLLPARSPLYWFNKTSLVQSTTPAERRQGVASVLAEVWALDTSNPCDCHVFGFENHNFAMYFRRQLHCRLFCLHSMLQILTFSKPPCLSCAGCLGDATSWHTGSQICVTVVISHYHFSCGDSFGEAVASSLGG